jgi:hypothetical protein
MPFRTKQTSHDDTCGYQELSDDRGYHGLFYQLSHSLHAVTGEDLLTVRPSDKRADPPVHPEILTPVVIQNPTYDHDPHVLRLGGRGTVSRLSYLVSSNGRG